MRRILLALVLSTSLIGCGFVRETVRDPLGAADRILAPVLEPTLPYILDGALNLLVVSLIVVSAGDVRYDDGPEWICYFACVDDDGDGEIDNAVARLDCANCDQEDGMHFATGGVALVVPAEGWQVEEIGQEGPFAASFPEPGESHWTWTDGDNRFEQTVFVSDAADVAIFDLDAGGEVDAIAIPLGETVQLEILPVDAEGRVLAAQYEGVTFADELVHAERAGFYLIEGSESGTVARVRGDVPGETTMTVEVAGLTRTIAVTVR